MYRKKDIRENIFGLIESSSFEGNRQLMKKIFGNLAELQEEKLQDIESRLLSENNHTERFWSISTALLKNNEELKNTGWSYMLNKNEKQRKTIIPQNKNYMPDDSYTDKIIQKDDGFIIDNGYIYGNLEEIEKLCGYDKKYTGTYNGKNFEYSLIRSNKLVCVEEQIYNLAEIYGIRVPIIYAPMSRRYVYIETKDKIFCDVQEKKNISLNLSENGLDGKLLLNFRSVWNISKESSPSPLTTAEKISDGKIRYTNEYPVNPNEYIYTENYGKKLPFIDSGKKDCIQIRYLEDRNIFTEKIILNNMPDTDIAGDYLFETVSVENQEHIIPRIKSKCDIEFVLKPFENTGLYINKISASKPDNMIICEYPPQYQYKKNNEDFFNSSGRTVFVAFSGTDDIFIEDKIIMAINYLQRNYPEFDWKGGLSR